MTPWTFPGLTPWYEMALAELLDARALETRIDDAWLGEFAANVWRRARGKAEV